MVLAKARRVQAGYCDDLVEQPWGDYSAEQHEVWRVLFERQSALVRGRAAQACAEGLARLDIGAGAIPRFDQLSRALRAATGWEIVAVNGLLSVDNSLAIAAMASRLPEHQQGRALNWGMAGAYGFRCICLLFASVILENYWVKLVGALYLIYLMCQELTAEERENLLKVAANYAARGTYYRNHLQLMTERR